MLTKLGDVATYVNGYAFKPTDWSDTGLPIIRIQDLTGNAYKANRYNGKYDKKYEVNRGDILVSWSASLGVYVWSGEKAVLNQHIFKVIFDKVDVNPVFFMYQAQNVLENAISQAHGATMKHLTKPVFDALPFDLPQAAEQQRIAAVLDKVTTLISLRRQQLTKLDGLVRSRFTEMFGDPEANTMHWNKMPLSVCLNSTDHGKSFVCGALARTGDRPAVLKLSAATYGVYRSEENKVILDEAQFVQDAEVQKGDLRFTRKNTPELVGMCAYVYDTPSRLMMPDLLFRLNTNEQCSKIFLWKLINHDLFRSRIQSIATGTAKSMSNISKERLMHLRIILPPLRLQEQFAAFVYATEKSKSAVQQSLNQLELLKKSLMQQYFG